LSHIPSLTTLHLTSEYHYTTHISKTVILPNLTYLYTDRLTDNSLFLLKCSYTMEKIINLTVSGSSCRDIDLSVLSNLKHLEHLDIFDAKHITDEGLMYLAPIQSLKSVRLPWKSRHITYRGLEFIKNVDIGNFVTKQPRHWWSK